MLTGYNPPVHAIDVFFLFFQMQNSLYNLDSVTALWHIIFHVLVKLLSVFSTVILWRILECLKYADYKS